MMIPPIIDGFIVNGDTFDKNLINSNQTIDYHHTSTIISSSNKYASDFVEHRELE
ncbi:MULTISPECIES: hypothetical protein [Mesonia]|mgnify:FL=1|uniref:Uncharacterized protein n=1 Tax=Mesonia oceanica TaxID=2687242 RepID=A0AC61YCL0_9FLAO|nr:MULTISPECIES: hypothetical protein [Mesonia]VVV02133.1 hypothetical protein FVB9532_03429 [Mesonia oceanica]